MARGRRWLVAAAVVLASIGPASCGGPRAPQGTGQQGGQPLSGAPAADSPSPPSDVTILHYIANLHGEADMAAALGYNLFDTGSDPSDVAALPAGARALVWLGGLGDSTRSCATPGYSWSEFTAAVDRFTGDPRVYGYFLSDEPRPEICPTAAAQIRQRADYIRTHDPQHRSFIVILDGTSRCHGRYGCEYSVLNPQNTHVDLVGVDVYPCSHTAGCKVSKIDERVHAAEANGIPESTIVPVIGTFGDTCAPRSGHYYLMPSAADLHAILSRWAQLIPNPAFDFTYTWGHQSDACPTLVDADGRDGYPDLQSIMHRHNTG
jgi:hypothetical protein